MKEEQKNAWQFLEIMSTYVLALPKAEDPLDTGIVSFAQEALKTLVRQGSSTGNG
jgi:hypothetical protein